MTHTLSAEQIIVRRRARKSRRAEQAGQRRFWGWLAGIVFTLAVGVPAAALGGVAAVIYAGATRGLPPPDQASLSAAVQTLAAASTGSATEFYDRDDSTLLYRARDPLAPETWVSLDTLPPYVVSATLMSEDPGFLTRSRGGGVGGVATAVVRMWGQILVGGVPADTTITGRLVRNVAAALPTDAGDRPLGDTRSREIALIAELNRRYSARDLLEWHLNTNDYGGSQSALTGDAFGIEAAAQRYFGKRAVDLTLSEAAVLASIPPAPQYNPVGDAVAARARGADLLRAMYNAGEIGEGAFNTATDEVQNTLVFRAAPGGDSDSAVLAPEYITLARAQTVHLLDGLGLSGAQLAARGGLRVTTALDLDLQAQATCARDAALARLNRAPVPTVLPDGSRCIAAANLPELSADFALGGAAADGTLPDSGSVVVLDARTGELRALVGEATAVNAQPAITLLPFVYFEGFNGGSGGLYTPATMVYDVPRQFPGSEEGLIYAVDNPDRRTRGPLSVRAALGGGLLPPAADVAYRQGIGGIVRTAHQMGVNSLGEGATGGDSASLLLLQRGGAVSPLDMAYAYTVFASGGDIRGVLVQPVAAGYRSRDPVVVLEIADSSGRVLWQYDRAAAGGGEDLTTSTPLLERGLAYLVNDILADSEMRWDVVGRDTALELPGREAAVVNGTSDDTADNWTAGYTPQYVTVAHLSRSDRAGMALPPYALDGAAALWHAVMQYVHTRDNERPAGWERPDTIVDAAVCERSGLAPNGICPTVAEIFFQGTQPRIADTYWQEFEINRDSGQLATVNTPPSERTTARFFVPPEEFGVRDWWVANRLPLPPTEVDTVSVARSERAARILSPEAYSYIGGEVAVTGELAATVRPSDIQFWQVSVGQGLNPTEWTNLTASETDPVPTNDALATWNTAGLNGLYSLRWVVTLDDNRVESDVLLVTVDNIAPTLTLDSAEPGKIYRWPGETQVEVVAEAADNLGVARVAFYHGDEFLGEDTSWPFSFTWDIDAPGAETFSAIAYDAVGNQAEATLTVEILRG